MEDRTKNEQNAVTTDGEHERGEHPVGKKVHYSTVTHAYRGTLETVTPSYFILAPGSYLVAETGDMGEYFTRVKGGEEVSADSKIAGRVYVHRGAVAWSLVFE